MLSRRSAAIRVQVFTEHTYRNSYRVNHRNVVFSANVLISSSKPFRHAFFIIIINVFARLVLLQLENIKNVGNRDERRPRSFFTVTIATPAVSAWRT